MSWAQKTGFFVCLFCSKSRVWKERIKYYMWILKELKLVDERNWTSEKRFEEQINSCGETERDQNSSTKYQAFAFLPVKPASHVGAGKSTEPCKGDFYLVGLPDSLIRQALSKWHCCLLWELKLVYPGTNRVCSPSSPGFHSNGKQLITLYMFLQP